MKTKFSTRFLCFLLSLFMLFGFSACDGGEEQSTTRQTDPQTEAETTPPPSNAFVPDAELAIVYGALYAEDEDTQWACKYLKRALEAAYGITAQIVDDATEINAKKEFLVGFTNRSVSKQLTKSLSLNDYTYNVASTQAIVISGGIPEHTYTAVKKFCEDILTYDGTEVKTKNPEIKLRSKYNHYAKYDYDSVMINGILWEDYTLAVSTPSDIQGAIEINKQFGQYTGQLLPIVLASEMTGDEESIFRAGAAYRLGKKSDTLTGYLINTYKDDAGNVICFEATSPKYYTTAVGEVFNRAKQESDGLNVSFTVGDETVTRINLSPSKAEYTHWTVAEETTKTISEGVTYTEQLYYSDSNTPYRVYTLVVDTKINKIEMGSSNDGYDYTLTESQRQTTQQHMQAAVKNGKNVIAGINADFFNMGGNYCPWGMTIKDGQLITHGTTATRPKLTADNIRPFFGFTKDGKPVIAMESEYPKNSEQIKTLDTAVGGAYILAEEGQLIYRSNQSSLTHGGVHPRALVGFREDGTVILMVIDGRQPTHSNGASHLQCSVLMHRFGASDTLLLDGGGSSCMVLRDPETNVYTTVDKPSDGQLRKIYNSLIVIKK